MRKWEKVQVGTKIDLDTVGVGFLFGITRQDKVEVLPTSQASEEDLSNPSILCIEVGGSGRVNEGNFDHHGLSNATPLCSATWQAWEAVGRPEETKNLVHYIEILDVKGPQALREKEGYPGFPTLSDVFSGVLLRKPKPLEQFHKGIEILSEVVQRKINPFERIPIEEIPQWRSYAEAKAENDQQLAEAVKNAQWGQTREGLKIAWLETSFIGALQALYEASAQVVVVFHPAFGPAKVRKFTIAGNNVRVDAILPELNAREPGWGGPSTGTILGSPRGGSKLTLNEVVEIVRKTL